MQDSSSKQNRIDLNNFLLDSKLWENVLSFHINDHDEIKIVYLQKKAFFNLLAIISLKKKLVEYFIDLILNFMYLHLVFFYVKSIYSSFIFINFCLI